MGLTVCKKSVDIAHLSWGPEKTLFIRAAVAAHGAMDNINDNVSLRKILHNVLYSCINYSYFCSRMSRNVDIQPHEGELPSQFAERVGNAYATYSVQKEKRDKGQFFTPLAISQFMGSLARTTDSESIRILDPGCGSAILSCSLIEHLVQNNTTLKKINLDLYDTDTVLIPYTEIVLGYLSDWLRSKGVQIDLTIHQEDFILVNHTYISGTNLFNDNIVLYDYIISNPPYFKLAKDDTRTQCCASIVDGQTNIYALFMAICSKMLNESGEMIFITPRSFASGRYFQSFRDYLFENTRLCFVHLFNTRKDTFAKDDVLQELVITRFANSNNGRITISHSEGSRDLNDPVIKDYPETDILDPSTADKVVFLPTDDRDDAILNLFRSWDGNMEKYDIKISTGPVVAFRIYDYITSDEDPDTVPLYWMHNVVKMLADHPVNKKDKGQYIKVAPESMHTLLPNKNYILLRRMSSKDDSSRLVAAPYFGNMAKYKYVGIENKLNYIYRPKGHLRRDETIGLTALLDSDLFDGYFRTFNGNINVSATELRAMPLPPIETIREIGKRIILNNNYSIDYINELVMNYFNI